jgi:choline kinase/phosphoglycolate phosphatase-like HAD superfamily hydrolase
VSPRTLLLDADDCLFPTEVPAFEASTRVTNAFLAELGVPRRFAPAELRAWAVGRNFRATAADLAAEAGILLPDELLERWVAEERRAVVAHLCAVLRPDPAVREPLETLAAAGHELAVVSSSALARLDACFEATGLADLLPAAVRCSAEDSLPVPTSKPDPAVYLHARERFGDDVLAVEDSPSGVRAAVAAGVPVLGLLQFVAPEERAEREAVLRAAGALDVAASWRDVVQILKEPLPVSHHAVHVVVLAAGRGSRLGTRMDDRPKWLLEVAGAPIADRHLAGIAEAGDAVASVRVATGHAAEAVRAWLADRDEEVGTLHVPEYAELNNWWTVLSALRATPPGERVAFINSDLFATPEAIGAFLADAARGGEEAVLAVDLERELTDESMKVATGPDGALSRIGKVGVDDPVGEYPGLLAVGGAARARFQAALEAFTGRPECANEWYEGAVGRTAAAGVRWAVWPMPSGAWVEIDDDGDLAAAEALGGVRS